MGLVSKTVKIKWSNVIKKHYESLGYKYTKVGQEFEVKVEHFGKCNAYCKTKEELHYIQLKDRYKRIKCIQAVYEYLEIPYTAFKKNSDKYKILINNKIKEIVEGRID